MPANFWDQRGAQARPRSQGRGTHVAVPGSDGAHLPLPDLASGPVTAAGSPGCACSGDMTQLTRQAVGERGEQMREEGQQMGEEGEQECLSQHNPLPRSFQGSCCWHPERGSRQWLRAPCEPGPSLRAAQASGEHTRPLTHRRCVPWARPVSSSSHIRNPFPRGPCWGGPHSWDHVPPARAQGTVTGLFQAGVMGTFPLPQQLPRQKTSPVPQKHHPPLRPWSHRQDLWPVLELIVHICQRLKWPRGEVRASCWSC